MAVRTREITDKEEWLGWRKANVNASEAGALFAIDKKTTPLMLYHRKLGTLPPDEETRAMRRGRWLEPAVIEATRELRQDLEIFQPKLYFDDPELRVGCTPDAFAIEKKTGRLGVVQAKTVGENVWKEWVESGDTSPLAYQLQTMVEAVQTTRADFAILSIMIVGYDIDMRIAEVPIVRQTWETFLRRVKRFWLDVEKRNAPPVMAPDADILKKLYPGEPGLTIDLTGNNMLPELLERHNALSAALKAARAENVRPLEKEYEAVRTVIKGFIGDAETAILPGGQIATFKPQTNPGWTARILHIKNAKG